MSLVAGWCALHFKKLCAELHKIVAFVQNQIPTEPSSVLLFMKGSLYACIFTWHTGPVIKIIIKKNSFVCCQYNHGSTKSFGRGIMRCLLLEASKLLSLFSVNM